LKRPETRSILQLIGHEVDAPGLIRRCSDELLFAMSLGFPLALWPLLQGQALFLAHPVHQILACVPALAVQQHADLAISVTHPALCDLPYPHPQLRPWLLMALVTICASHHQKNPARVPLARPILFAQMIDHRTAPDGRFIAPDEGGLTNYRSPSFDPQTGLFIVDAHPRYSLYFAKPPDCNYGWAGADYGL
jgi:hypothetical protein